MTTIAAMKNIALPERKILLPRLEFPRWLRFPRGVSDERVARMIAPLGGMLTPLGVSVTTPPWYLAGGASNCIAAYQPKGAASLAASYVNLANAGTYDAAPGVAPTLSLSGWVFNGTSQYLLTGITYEYTYTVIVQCSGITNNGYLFGDFSPCCAQPNRAGNLRRWRYSATADISPAYTSGNFCMAANKRFLNGGADGTFGGAWVSSAISFPIGCVYFSGAYQFFIAATVQAAALYSRELSSSEVSAVAAAMAAL